MPSMSEPEGVELFLARARRSVVELSGGPTVSELCARLDNLPLALELAASRTVVFSPGAAARIAWGERLDLLRGGRDADPRQQTLRATIAWSYELLGARSSVCSPGCPSSQAGAARGRRAGMRADPDTLQALLDKSLRLAPRHRRRPSVLDARDNPRVRCRTARRRGGIRTAARAPRRMVPRFRRGGRTRVTRRRSRSLVDRLPAEHDNLRAVLPRRARSAISARSSLVTSMWRFWAERGYIREGLRHLQDVLERSPDEPPRAVIGRSYLRTMTGGSFADALHEAQAVACGVRTRGRPFHVDPGPQPDWDDPSGRSDGTRRRRARSNTRNASRMGSIQRRRPRPLPGCIGAVFGTLPVETRHRALQRGIRALPRKPERAGIHSRRASATRGDEGSVRHRARPAQ